MCMNDTRSTFVRKSDHGTCFLTDDAKGLGVFFYAQNKNSRGEKHPTVYEIEIKRRLFCVNADLLLCFCLLLELYLAVDQSEESIVLADADIRARMDVSAALTNENVASRYNLTVCTLDAEALGLGITTVLGRTYAFFMCHCVVPPFLIVQALIAVISTLV